MSKMEPKALAASIFAIMASNSVHAEQLDINLAASLGYGQQEKELSSHKDDKAIIDVMDDELSTALLDLQISDRRRLIVQSKVLTGASSDFEPLHIHGTLSSIYDYVAVDDATDSIVTNNTVSMPVEDRLKKIIYANSEQGDFSQAALKGSSIVQGNNPYENTSTDEVNAYDKTDHAQFTGEKIAVESVGKVETIESEFSSEKRTKQKQLADTFGYTAAKQKNKPVVDVALTAAKNKQLSEKPDSIIGDNLNSSRHTEINNDVNQIIEKAASSIDTSEVAVSKAQAEKKQLSTANKKLSDDAKAEKVAVKPPVTRVIVKNEVAKQNDVTLKVTKPIVVKVTQPATTREDLPAELSPVQLAKQLGSSRVSELQAEMKLVEKEGELIASSKLNAEPLVDTAKDDVETAVTQVEAAVEDAGDKIAVEKPVAKPTVASNTTVSPTAPAVQATAAQTKQPRATQPTARQSKPAKTESMVPPKKPISADAALKQKEGDATSEKSLEEVFTASEKRYSLLKQGDWGLNYDARYSYYRDSRIDLATQENSSNILRLRVEEDAQHTIVNSFNLQYGLKDNFTLSADLPIIAKTDLIKDTSTVGLGDMSLGARWEPFPLEKDRLPLIFNGNITLPTGDSPYEINRNKDLSTGRGYYGIGGGVSTRKYIDPVVLFGSASVNYGFREEGLDQLLGGDRTLVGVRPNLGAGIALGFAYSLNYDVSLTMSYQQSFSVGSEFTVRQVTNNSDGTTSLTEVTNSSADQTSATLNMALGVRVSPKTIVNTSVGIGLTEDAPDVSLGVSFPLDFSGFGKKTK